MNSASTYRAKLRKLHTLIRQGRDESPEGEETPEAEALRESMLDDWNAMTPAEQHGARLLSERLHRFRDLKDFLNTLAAAQHQAKLFRKKKYREANAEAWAAFQKKEAWKAFNGRMLFWNESGILRRKARINAALNLHHELRGSEHRHKITPDTLFWSEEAQKEVEDRFRPKGIPESEVVGA